MKSLILISLLSLSSFAFATEYKCATQSCSYSDGCDTYYHYILIQGRTVKYWMDLTNVYSPSPESHLDYSDIRNVKKDKIRVGTLEDQTLENGNYIVTGPGLVAKGDFAPKNFLYRENEIYASLIEGRKYGRMIEKTHIHRENKPNIENKPIQDEYKCTLLEE